MDMLYIVYYGAIIAVITIVVEFYILCFLFRDELEFKHRFNIKIICIIVFILLFYNLIIKSSDNGHCSTFITSLLTFFLSLWINERIVKPRNKLRKIKGKLSSCIEILEVLKEKKQSFYKNNQLESKSYNTNKKNVNLSNNKCIPLGINYSLENIKDILSDYYNYIPEMSEKIKNDILKEIKKIAFEIAGLYEAYPKVLPKLKINEIIIDFTQLDFLLQ